MLYNLIKNKKSRNYILAGSLFLATISNNVYADDIFKGMRGPTNWQVEERVVYFKKKDIGTLTNNLFLKYWDGDKSGLCCFVNLPYKLLDSQKESNVGLKDITIAIGPRGKIDKFYYILYGAATFPTGNYEKRLGAGRFDKKIGGLFTYLTENKKFETDLAIEYNFTGKNKNKVDSPNEIYAGLLVGGKITDKLRFATGFTDIIRTNNHYLNYRTVVRYTVSPALHFEIMGDLGIDKKKTHQGNSLGLFMRYNF